MKFLGCKKCKERVKGTVVVGVQSLWLSGDALGAVDHSASRLLLAARPTAAVLAKYNVLEQLQRYVGLYFIHDALHAAHPWLSVANRCGWLPSAHPTRAGLLLWWHVAFRMQVPAAWWGDPSWATSFTMLCMLPSPS